MIAQMPSETTSMLAGPKSGTPNLQAVASTVTSAIARLIYALRRRFQHRSEEVRSLPMSVKSSRSSY